VRDVLYVRLLLLVLSLLTGCVDVRLYACSAALDYVVTSPALRAAMFFFLGLGACNVYLHGATRVPCKL